MNFAADSRFSLALDASFSVTSTVTLKQPSEKGFEGVTAPGVYATDDQFVEGAPSAALTGRIEHVARLASSMMRAASSR